MSSTPHFAHCDTKKPDGFYVQFERVIEDDDSNPRPDQHRDGFWPSRDPSDAGYVGDVSVKEFRRHEANAKRRMTNWERGHWRYIGVRARALCLIVNNGVGTYINLDSPGLWGIESDAGKYLDEVYAEEVDALKNMIAAMRDPIYD